MYIILILQIIPHKFLWRFGFMLFAAKEGVLYYIQKKYLKDLNAGLISFFGLLNIVAEKFISFLKDMNILWSVFIAWKC